MACTDCEETSSTLPNGIPGTNGTLGGGSIKYTYTGGLVPPPIIGTVGVNNDDLGSITKVNADNTDTAGNDVSAFLAAVPSGSLISLYSIDTPQRFINVRTTAVPAAIGSYTQFTVTPLSYNSGLIDGEEIAFAVAPSGIDGAAGTTGAGYGDTSTTSLTIGAGVQTLTIATGKAYNTGSRVRIASTAAPTTVYMDGPVTSYTSATGVLVVTVDTTLGAGTLTAWTISLVGSPGTTGTNGTNGTGYLTTSTTSLTIGTGSKTFTTTQASNTLAWTAGARIRATDSGNPTTNYMEGVVTSYSGTTLVVTMDRTVGSGTIATWDINAVGDVNFQDTGWIDLSGFAWLPSGTRPQYRVINKMLRFRGYLVVPIDSAGSILPYTSEADYIASMSVTPNTLATGGVTLTGSGGNESLTFNQGAAAIPSSTYYPDTTYVSQWVIGTRRIRTQNDATIPITYSTVASLYISSSGVIGISTIFDSENYTGVSTGSSQLRMITSNAVAGDYVLDYRKVDNGAGNDTLAGITSTSDLTVIIQNQGTNKHSTTLDAALAGNLGGFAFDISKLSAYIN